MPVTQGNEPESTTANSQSSNDLISTEQNELASASQGEKKVIQSPEEFNASNLPLISAIPNRNIYLYGKKPKGVVLRVNGREREFDWLYMTPRFVLPRMYVSDFNFDGKDELAVILYIGSGTGVSVEELHIIDISENEDTSDSNSMNLLDHGYESKYYFTALNELVKVEPNNQGSDPIAIIKVVDKSYPLSLKQWSEATSLVQWKDTRLFLI